MEARAKEDVDNGVIAKLIIESRGVNIDDDDKMDKKDSTKKITQMHIYNKKLLFL